MIDIKGELKNYPPINLANFENSGNIIPDNIKNSIALYNKALESIRTNSEDIAIIELRKAVSMNPDFYEAMNLLGLSYNYTKDYAKATEMFERVVAAENNSVKALQYMDMMSMGDDVQGMAPKKSARKRGIVRENMRPIKKSLKATRQDFREVNGSAIAGESSAIGKSEIRTGKLKGKLSLIDSIRISSKQDILKYVIGLVVGILIIMMINLFASAIPEKLNTNSELDESVKKLTEDAALNKLKYENLNSEYEALKKSFEATNTNMSYYRSVIKLYEAESILNKKDYEGAADLLILLKAAEFNGEDKVKFDKLCSQAMPNAAWAAYQKGISLVSSEMKYAQALEKLNKIQLYQENFENMDATLYYIGKSYQQLNDSRNAVAVFQKLLEKYPKSKYIGWAEARLAELVKAS